VPQYAVALVLPDIVEKELERLRGEFTSRVVFVPVAHITLIYPFESSRREELLSTLELTVRRLAPFRIILHGIKYFELPERVAYLAVGNPAPVVNIHNVITESFAGLIPGTPEPGLTYLPHVTIAANIPPEVFPGMKQSFTREQPHFELTVESLILFVNGERGWEQERVFKLKR